MNQRYPQSRHTPHGGSEKTDTEKGTRSRKRKRAQALLPLFYPPPMCSPQWQPPCTRIAPSVAVPCVRVAGPLAPCGIRPGYMGPGGLATPNRAGVCGRPPKQTADRCYKELNFLSVHVYSFFSNRCSFAHPASYFLHSITLFTFFACKFSLLRKTTAPYKGACSTQRQREEPRPRVTEGGRRREGGTTRQGLVGVEGTHDQP